MIIIYILKWVFVSTSTTVACVLQYTSNNAKKRNVCGDKGNIDKVIELPNCLFPVFCGRISYTRAFLDLPATKFPALIRTRALDLSLSLFHYFVYFFLQMADFISPPFCLLSFRFEIIERGKRPISRLLKWMSRFRAFSGASRGRLLRPVTFPRAGLVRKQEIPPRYFGAMFTHFTMHRDAREKSKETFKKKKKLSPIPTESVCNRLISPRVGISPSSPFPKGLRRRCTSLRLFIHSPRPRHRVCHLSHILTDRDGVGGENPAEKPREKIRFAEYSARRMFLCVNIDLNGSSFFFVTFASRNAHFRYPPNPPFSPLPPYLLRQCPTIKPLLIVRSRTDRRQSVWQFHRLSRKGSSVVTYKLLYFSLAVARKWRHVILIIDSGRSLTQIPHYLQRVRAFRATVAKHSILEHASRIRILEISSVRREARRWEDTLGDHNGTPTRSYIMGTTSGARLLGKRMNTIGAYGCRDDDSESLINRVQFVQNPRIARKIKKTAKHVSRVDEENVLMPKSLVVEWLWTKFFRSGSENVASIYTYQAVHFGKFTYPTFATVSGYRKCEILAISALFPRFSYIKVRPLKSGRRYQAYCCTYT